MRDGARSVFLPLPPDADTLRRVFREAGAHVWLDTSDVLVAGRGFAMIHAATGGVKRIRLPEATTVREIFGASPARENVRVIEERLGFGETRVYRLSPVRAAPVLRARSRACSPRGLHPVLRVPSRAALS